MTVVNVQIDDLPDADHIPAGEYKLRIDQVHDPETDKNGVDYIRIDYSVIEGEHTNRKVFDSYVPLTGSSKLKKILRACKYANKVLSDTNDLVGYELKAVVKIRTQEGFDPQARITSYMTTDGERVV